MIRICINVDTELPGDIETPWCESFRMKVVTLPERYKELMDLHLLGNSISTIGTILGIGSKTAEARYQRALRQLTAWFSCILSC